MSDRWRKLFPKALRTKADPILDGHAYFESLSDAIEKTYGSENYIYILGWMLDVTFSLRADDPSKTLLKLLQDADRKGVEIRILIWDNPIPEYAARNKRAVGELSKLQNARVSVDEHTYFPPALRDYLHKNTGPYLQKTVLKIGKILEDFRPEAAAQLATVSVKDVSLENILYRILLFLAQPGLGAHHEKVAIVKNSSGLVAYCGGMDINKGRIVETIGKKEYPFPSVHDTACRLEGPAAHEVLQRFKRRWHNHGGVSSVTLRGENEPVPKPRATDYPYATAVGTYNSPDGRDKDRSGRDAYMAIVENAREYIYLEDQYVVNVDVGKALNKKIKQDGFQKVIIGTQDMKGAMDMFLPNRKRTDFYKALTDGATAEQQKKILFAVLDRRRYEKDHYHAGMHAKTLIADDEIAMIGSMNLNLRSFTNDSETCVVVYDDRSKLDDNFARSFRIATWKEFLRRAAPRSTYITATAYASAIEQSADFSILVQYDAGYERNDLEDADERLNQWILEYSLPLSIAVYGVTGDLTTTSRALDKFTVIRLFDDLWTNIVEPDAG
jgi:phosphatidylserine/phosphatidylglycerophosphate/cardiolipin synthase-like enzyme